MAYAVFDSADMMGQLFGKGQGGTDEAGDTLPQRVMETLDMIGFPRVLRDRLVLHRRNAPLINGVLSGIGHECGRYVVPVDPLSK